MLLNTTENMNTQTGALPVVVAAVNFKTEVLDSKQPVLVEFGTAWRRQCQRFESVLQELAIAWAGKIKVVKVKTDDSLDLTLRYAIKFVPTLICFVEGSPCVQVVVTDAGKDAILAKIKLLLGTSSSSS